MAASLSSKMEKTIDKKWKKTENVKNYKTFPEIRKVHVRLAWFSGEMRS